MRQSSTFSALRTVGDEQEGRSASFCRASLSLLPPPPSQTQKTRNHTKEFCCELTVPGKLHKGKQTPMDRNVPSKSILIPHFRTQTPQKIIFSNVPAAATTVTGPLKLPSGLQLHYLHLDSQKLKLFPMLMWDRRVPLPNTN